MKYTKPTFTADSSEKINSLAAMLKRNIKDVSSSEQAVIVVRRWLNDNAYSKSYSPPRPHRTAKNLIESRTIKASELVDRPMASCGSQTTLGTAILRAMGYKVKMVHGKHPKSHHHAWISIHDENTKSWHEYDFTGYGIGPAGKITPEHMQEIGCEDWNDIIDLLDKQHIEYTNTKRR
ncbi:MAG: hypothetical protein NTY56_00405 [Patescibacteria group bacterium]|nr:hypothetical protein [Patescibacteria group bacterium]